MDARCDEGSHLSPVTDLSVIRPLEPEAMLILTLNSRYKPWLKRKGEKEEEEMCPNSAPFIQSSARTSNKADVIPSKLFGGKCPSQKWRAGTLGLTVDYRVKDSSLFLHVVIRDHFVSLAFLKQSSIC